MFAKLKNESLRLASIVRMAPVLVITFLFLTIAANAQTVSSNGQNEAEKPVEETTETVKTPVLMPVWKNYKEVTIGMTADDVKEKLGKAEIADKDGFYYEFDNDETAQIALDADKKVRAIIVMYKLKNANAPKFEEVLGDDPG